MTPSERARHAANVRYGKENPFAARLAAIREKRKAKKGGKGKKAPKAKLTQDQKDAQRKAEEAKARGLVGQALSDADHPMLSPRGLEAMQAAADGQEPEKALADGLIASGLAERGADGLFRLSSDGKAALSAANRGDTPGTLEALSRLNDKNVARGEKDKEKVGKETEREKVKAEKERAKAEKEAKPKSGGGGGKGKKEEKDKDAEKEQERAENREKVYGALELFEDATGALSELAAGGSPEDDGGLVKMGLAEQARDGSYRMTSTGRAFVRAAERGDTAAARDALSRGKDRVGARQERDMARTERERARTQRRAETERRRQERKKPTKPGDKFDRRQTTKGADMPDYDTVLDAVEDAADDLATAADADLAEIKAGRRNSTSDLSRLEAIHDAAASICEMCEALGVEGMGGDEEDDAAVSLEGKAQTEDADDFVYGSEVKALDGDRVGALAIRFGSEDEPDMSHARDYFTKATDYWLDAWDRRPMLYHHALDESTQDAPRIGTWTKATVTSEGVWLEGQLDKAHRYYGAIKELIKRGILRVSSDSAPHLVLREARANGTHEVKRWPLMAASLTVSPAEPRLSAVSLKAVLAELGNDGIDDDPEASELNDGDRSDETKATDERLRKLLLQTRILSLQE
jgi:hypothetical protein